MNPVALLLHLLLCLALVRANVEKAVFVASRRVPKLPPPILAALESVHLESLSPQKASIRRHLRARVATLEASQGQSEIWIRLDGLQPGRRYEVRVCWSATQPTEFDLSLHEPAQALEIPGFRDLFSSQLILHEGLDSAKQVSPDNAESSLLLFQISAKADFFTNDALLMADGLLVDIDITLDPYILGVFPTSLLPTAGYLALIVLSAWFISSIVVNFLSDLASPLRDKSNGSKKTE